MNTHRTRQQYYRPTLTIGIAILGGALAGPAVAQQPEAATTPPADAQIDIERSRVFARVGKIGLGHEHGVEGRFKSGWLKLGASENAGQLVFDLTTFTADTEVARSYVGLKEPIEASDQQQVTETLRGHEVLDVDKHPTATFSIRSAKSVPPPKGTEVASYELEGDFVLHGVRRPLQVKAIVLPVDNNLRVHGKFVIKQSDFGIKPYSKFLGTVRVADELTIWGDAWLPATATK
ncbi:MAG: YceI family protein [Pirellulales bacterium]